MRRRAISAALAASFAWVLWAEFRAIGYEGDLPLPQQWRIVNAFETKKMCDAEQQVHMKDLRDTGWRIMGTNSGAKELPGWNVTYRYLCLPGMLDPRPRE